jgi:trk system potassium uptake protein
MFVVVLGGGKIGANVARSLVRSGHEVVVVESDRARFDTIEAEFRPFAILGDATEIYVLERAGIKRPPDIVVAATGDDEDNIVICQLAKEKYGVQKVIARVNDPRNQEHFDLLGIRPTVAATPMILALIEHEVPEHGLVHLLELRDEQLEIVEVEIADGAPAVGKRVEQLQLPSSTRLVSVMRDGRAEIAVGSTQLRRGDQVLAILEPGAEEELRGVLLGAQAPASAG